MDRKILLDTNLIISAFDTKSPEAREQLRILLEDDQVAFAISPLIRYEVLRGVGISETERHGELESVLNGFVEFDIGRDVANLSSNLFRYVRSNHNKEESSFVDKRSFDIFHYATAKCNELELCSNDGDLGRLERIHKQMET